MKASSSLNVEMMTRQAFLMLMMKDDDRVLRSRHVKTAPPLEADPGGAAWRKAPLVVAERDRFGQPLPEAKTEIRSLWTEQNLYLLFSAHYQTMYLRPEPQLDQETFGLWDYDVCEVFIGEDLERIHLYKEFEVSPRRRFGLGVLPRIKIRAR